jgi:hypothetical protein
MNDEEEEDSKWICICTTTLKTVRILHLMHFKHIVHIEICTMKTNYMPWNQRVEPNGLCKRQCI